MTIALLILAGISAAIMWKIQFHWERSIFSEYKGRGDIWLSPMGWVLKYKNGDHNQGRRFFGSTTFLVWLTDGFHFFQMVMFTSLEAAIVLNGFDLVSLVGGTAIPPWVVFVLNVAALKGCRGFTFELIFKYLLDMDFWKKINIGFRIFFANFPRFTSIVLMLTGFAVLIGISFTPRPYGHIVVIILVGGGVVILLYNFIKELLAKPSQSPIQEEEEDTPSH